MLTLSARHTRALVKLRLLGWIPRVAAQGPQTPQDLLGLFVNREHDFNEQAEWIDDMTDSDLLEEARQNYEGIKDLYNSMVDAANRYLGSGDVNELRAANMVLAMLDRWDRWTDDLEDYFKYMGVEHDPGFERFGPAVAVKRGGFIRRASSENRRALRAEIDQIRRQLLGLPEVKEAMALRRLAKIGRP